MNKKTLLDNLYAKYAFCTTENQFYIPGARAYVPGYGNPDSNIVLIGEAPGQEEEFTQKPFQGRSGQLLRYELQQYNLNDSNLFITNVVKFRPPQNRKPTREEILLHSVPLQEEIEIIKPQFIILVGATALSVFFNQADQTIGRLQGKVQKHPEFSYYFFPLYHPAYILRNMNALPIFQSNIKYIASYIKDTQNKIN